MLETKCPYCGQLNNVQRPVGDEHLPRENDLSLCSYCLHLSEFDKDLNLIKANEAKILDDLKKTKPEEYLLFLQIKAELKKSPVFNKSKNENT